MNIKFKKMKTMQLKISLEWLLKMSENDSSEILTVCGIFSHLKSIVDDQKVVAKTNNSPYRNIDAKWMEQE